MKDSTSDLLIANCDEFIYYDDLVREKKKPGERRAGQPKGTAPKAKPAGRKCAEPPVGATARSVVAAKTAAAEAPGEAACETRGDEERRQEEALELIAETVDALISERGEEEKIWGSMVKQALKRRKPGFNESYYGFRSFNGLLEAAERRGELALERDEKSGGSIARLDDE